jgi:hypothetical protein
MLRKVPERSPENVPRTGRAARCVVTALIIFFPAMINGVLGLRSVPSAALELMAIAEAADAREQLLYGAVYPKCLRIPGAQVAKTAQPHSAVFRRLGQLVEPGDEIVAVTRRRQLLCCRMSRPFQRKTITQASIEAARLADFRRSWLFSRLRYCGPGTDGKTVRLNVPAACRQAAQTAVEASQGLAIG